MVGLTEHRAVSSEIGLIWKRSVPVQLANQYEVLISVLAYLARLLREWRTFTPRPKLTDSKSVSGILLWCKPVRLEPRRAYNTWCYSVPFDSGMVAQVRHVTASPRAWKNQVSG